MLGAVAEWKQWKSLLSRSQLADLLSNSNDHHIHLLHPHMAQGEDIYLVDNDKCAELCDRWSEPIHHNYFHSSLHPEGFEAGHSWRDEGRAKGSNTAAVENQSCQDARTGCHSVRAVVASALCNLHYLKIRYEFSIVVLSSFCWDFIHPELFQYFLSLSLFHPLTHVHSWHFVRYENRGIHKLFHALRSMARICEFLHQSSSVCIQR